MRAMTAAAVALFALSGAALAQAPALPAALKPGELKAYLAVPAKGVQIYACNKNDAGAYVWTFKGPEAELTDTAGKAVGKHYGGPTRGGRDGGKGRSGEGRVGEESRYWWAPHNLKKK